MTSKGRLVTLLEIIWCGSFLTLQVEIGGGSNYDRVAIYNLTLHEFDEPLTKTTVYGITSDKENRQDFSIQYS